MSFSDDTVNWTRTREYRLEQAIKNIERSVAHYLDAPIERDDHIDFIVLGLLSGIRATALLALA